MEGKRNTSQIALDLPWRAASPHPSASAAAAWCPSWSLLPPSPSSSPEPHNAASSSGAAWPSCRSVPGVGTWLWRPGDDDALWAIRWRSWFALEANLSACSEQKVSPIGVKNTANGSWNVILLLNPGGGREVRPEGDRSLCRLPESPSVPDPSP